MTHCDDGQRYRALEPVRGDASIDLSTVTQQGSRLAGVDNPNPYVYGERLEQVIAHHARVAPEAVAIEQSGRTITYGSLVERAEGVASELVRLGVRPDSIVAVVLDRSIDLVVTLLGILRAGAAYVACDSSWPRARLLNVAHGADACLLVAEDDVAQPLKQTSDILTANPSTLFAGDAALAPAYETDGGCPASVFFTSGTTGRPKGVLSPHRGTIRAVVNCPGIPLSSETVFLQAAPLPWDGLSLELWAPLLNGGRSVLLERGATALDAELLETAVRQGVNTVWLTSSLLVALAEERLDTFAGLNLILTGGERVPVAAARLVLDRFSGLHLVNGYGPAESTIFATSHVVRRDDVAIGTTEIPIGTPIPKTTLMLLDSTGHPGPIAGEFEGEIAIGGDGVALGYVNDPEQTQQRFVKIENRRYYRTGDLARRDENGLYWYRGRIDSQIKMHGVRIEPGEIESVLETDTTILAACAMAISTNTKRRQLVAVYTTVDRKPRDPRELEALTATHLIKTMVPKLFLHVDRIPTNSNGKTDRDAVASLFLDHLAAKPKPAPDGSTIAPSLAEVRALLDQPALTTSDDLLNAGISSLDVIQLAARLGRQLNARLRAADIYKLRTIDAITEFCEAAAPLPPLPTANHDDGKEGPLSRAQQRFWLAEMASPGNTDNSIVLAYLLEGPLQREALEEALEFCVNKHQILRTVYGWDGEGPRQRVLQLVTVPLERVAMPATFDETNMQELAETLVSDWWEVPFALESEPPLRLRLCSLPNGRYIFCVHIHHIAFDGTSEHEFMADLRTAYTDACRGCDSELATREEKYLSYLNYAKWEQNQLAEWAANDVPHWTKQLAAIPPPFLPPPISRTEAIRREMVTRISPENVNAITASCATLGVPLLAGLTAAAGFAISSTFNVTDFTLGSVTSGRYDPALQKTIGYFVNPFVVQLQIVSDERLALALRRVAESIVDGLDHSQTPFDEIVARLAPARGRHPFFQVFVVLQLQPPDGAFGAGVQITPIRIRPPRTAIELMIEAFPDSDGSWTVITLWREDGLPADLVTHLVAELSSSLNDIAAL